jgi:hypothetical protein
MLSHAHEQAALGLPSHVREQALVEVFRGAAQKPFAGQGLQRRRRQRRQPRPQGRFQIRVHRSHQRISRNG